MLPQPRLFTCPLTTTILPPPLPSRSLHLQLAQASCRVLLLFISLRKFCKFCQFSRTKLRSPPPSTPPRLYPVLCPSPPPTPLPTLCCRCHWLQVSALLSFLLNTMKIAGPRLLFATPPLFLPPPLRPHTRPDHPCLVDASAVTFSLHFVSLPLR